MNKLFLNSTSLWALVACSPSDNGSGAQTKKPDEPAAKPTEPAAKSTTSPAAGSQATPAKAQTSPTHASGQTQAKTGGAEVRPLHGPGQGPAAKTGKAPEKGKTDGKNGKSATKGKTPEKKGRGSAENQDLRTRVWAKFKSGHTQTVQELSKSLGAPEKKIRSAIDGLRSMVDRPDGREQGIKNIHNVGRNMFSTDRKAKAKSA